MKKLRPLPKYTRQEMILTVVLHGVKNNRTNEELFISPFSIRNSIVSVIHGDLHKQRKSIRVFNTIAIQPMMNLCVDVPISQAKLFIRI